MADGGEQRGPDPVALGEPAGLLGLAHQTLTVEDDGGLGGERAEHPAVLGGQHPAGQREGQVVADRHVDVGVVGPAHRGGPHRPGAGPRLHVAAALQQGDGLHREGLADPLQQRVQGGLAAQHAAGEEGEDLRLGAQPGGLVGAAGREVHHGGDRDRHREEDHDGDQVLRVLHGPGVGGRGEPVVQQHAADGGGGQRGSQPAEQGGGHRQEEEEQDVVGEAGGVLHGAEHHREQEGPDDADEPAPDDPGPAEPGPSGDGQAAALGDLLVGDDVDVEVGARLAGDGRADPGPVDVLPGLAAAGAQHDLGGVDAPGELQEGRGYVVADDMVEAAAQVLDQGALDRQLLRGGGGQAVAAGDVDGEDLAAGALGGHPGGAADESAALGPAGQPHDDAFAGLPGGADVVLTAVLLEVLVDPVRDPEQCQLAQGGEVAGAEVVREGGVHLVGLVDVAVRHPAAQRLGRHVDQLDLVGPADDLVGDGLTLPDAGDRLDDVAE